MNPWRARRVELFAHQGGSFEGPSSTLAAIDHALAVGATAIELDVHATRDGALVVCHDDTVDRTTNHRGVIAELTLDDLRQMDNAYWFAGGETVSSGRPDGEYPFRGRAPRDRRYGIATLEEVVRSFPGVVLNLDIKRTAPDVAPYEERLADELTRLGCRDTVIVASFHDAAIAAFRRAAPDVATSAATDESTRFYFSLDDDEPAVPPVAALQVPATVGDIDVVTARFVEVAHSFDLAVHVWTVNDEEEMERLLDRGIDGLITDRPSVLRSVMARRAVGAAD